MEYSELLRSTILNSPLTISNPFTVLSYLIEQLLTNYIFLTFNIAILTLFIFIFTTIIIRKRNSPTLLLSYILGIAIFYIALALKLLVSSFGSQIKSLDSKLYESLEGLSKNSNSSFLKTCLISVLSFLQKTGNISETESEKILSITTFKDEIEPLGKNIKHTNNLMENYHDKTKNSLVDLNIYDKRLHNLLGYEDSINFEFNLQNSFSKESNLKNNSETIGAMNFGNKKAVNFLAEPEKKIDTLKNNHVAKDDQNNNSNKDNQKENIDKRTKDKSTTPTQNINLNNKQESSKSSNFKEKINTKEKLPNAMLRYKTSEATSNNNLEDIENQYFHKILNVLDIEFNSNIAISKRYTEINKVLESTELDAVKFDSDVRKLISLGTKIDKEMRSFNVSIDKYDSIRLEFIANIKKISNLKNLNENLSLKQGSDGYLSNVLKHNEENSKSTKQESNQKISTVISSNLFIQWLLIIEFIFFILFFYLTLVDGDVYIFKLIACIFFGINAFIGILFMLHANFFDRDCILGKAPGCDSIFGKNFSQFNKYTNIDLKSIHNTKIELLREKFNLMKSKSDQIKSVLTNFFEEDYLSEFTKHNIIFLNLIDKIKFVKDDFKELTHSKINQKQFFEILDSMNLRLVQILNNLKLLDRKFMLELYTKEVIFSNFISSEKENILNLLEQQLEGKNSKINKKQRSDCMRILSKICDQKNTLDNMSNLLIIGSLFLSIWLIL